jgi:hypothetical protein
MTYFYQLLIKLEESKLIHSYLFWINTAILIYSSLPLFVFLLYRIINTDVIKSNLNWSIFLSSNILFHLFQYIGLCKYKMKTI